MTDNIARLMADAMLQKILLSAVVLLIFFMLLHFLKNIVVRYVDDNERRYRLRKIVGFSGYILALLGLIFTFSDRLGGLTVFLGVAGAGVAFALQEVIASAAGWVAMSFGRFYQVGDRVQLGGITGDVIDIGVLRTTLMECGGWIKGDQYNGRIVRVANSFIFKEPVFNYSSDFPFLWDEMIVPVRYGSDYEKARGEFQQVLDEITGEYAQRLQGNWRHMTQQYMLEDARLQPLVSVNLTENWAEFILRYVVDYKKRRSTRDAISLRILAVIENSQGDIRIGAPAFELANPADVRVSMQ
ncbi:MAG: mechanosensitive ion channel [Oceanospirillaceae bacterium]|nr:mechanosensitive ion channel [Oceanospirillaceae bacterium]MCP5335376.1 mechanosensitive ion channel [Oceanospirillaceae bacterium]